MPGGFGFEDEEREAGEREPATGSIAPTDAQPYGSGHEQLAHHLLPPQSPQLAQPTPSLYGQPAPTSRPLGSGEPPWGGSGRPAQPSGPAWGPYGQQAEPSEWGQFGQPTQPSGGYYGQPGPASGWGGYGQAAAPSGWGPSSNPGTYGSGARWSAGPTTNGGYGTYSTGAPSSPGWSGTSGPEVARYVPGGYQPEGYGQASDYMPGGYGPPSGYGAHSGYVEGTSRDWGTPTEARRSSRTRLLVTLGVVAAVLLVALAGAGYAVLNVFTPQATVDNFCGDLRGGRYADAYNLLEGTAQSQVTATGFALAQVTLVRVSAGIVRCGVNRTATTYQYHPGDTSATLNVAIQWASAGRMTGWAHLKNDGGWKIAALDSSLFGVNLGALSAVTTYCQALIDQDYTAVYQLLSSQQRAQVPGLGPGPKPGAGPEYVKVGQWQDAIDGPVQACQVANLGKGNTDAAVHLPVTLTRAKLGQRQDDVALAVESGAWKITSIGPQLQGTDMGPMVVATRFCADVGSGNYADAWSLANAAEQAAVPKDQFAGIFDGRLLGYKVTSCTLDISTLKVTGMTAAVQGTAQVKRLSDGTTGQVTLTITMTKVGDAWKY